MLDFLDPIFDSFIHLFFADKRSEARKFTLGCFLIVMIVIGVLSVIFWNSKLGD